ncbi:MAG: CsgG/HfaB family protein [Gemmatimonadota bacterium]
MIREVRSVKGLVIWALLATSGCATLGPRPVGTEDIPSLQERAAREPANGEVHLLLGAALAADDRCDEAVTSARRGRALRPEDPIGPLIIGECLEEAGEYDQALNLYAQFLFEQGDAPGAQAVEGRRTIALQLKARAMARDAVQNEETLAPAEPETVGVLPFVVDGDSVYHTLSVGLAHMLTTDLALLRRFPLVERVQLDALLRELELAPELIDPATAARTGRLMRASRMILGTVSVPSGADTRLGGNIVLETGELTEALATEGALGDILSLEKEFALRIAESLGYQLSEAERQRILENQPASLAAFLAFSRGLFAEGLGDYEAAAAFYGEALRADPQYGDAQVRLRGAAGVGMGQAQIAGLTFPTELGPGAIVGVDPMVNTLASSIMDIASHQSERATLDAGSIGTIVDVLMEGSEIFPLLEAIITIIIPISR